MRVLSIEEMLTTSGGHASCGNPGNRHGHRNGVGHSFSRGKGHDHHNHCSPTPPSNPGCGSNPPRGKASGTRGLRGRC